MKALCLWLVSIVVALALVATPHTVTAAATAPVGVWLTESRDGAIAIAPCDSGLCGALVWFQPGDGAESAPPVDEHNPKPMLRHRPLCGLTMITGLTETEGGWTGWIYNPSDGSTYHTQLIMHADDTLEVHGYVGIPLLGKSQIWVRAPADLGHC
ncbi:MAG: DUF2147 domain-containing protein [Azospirillaceae bacterium]|nr:DUF2147 domain-containing protein [Azospirillaceae bacterium]